MNILLQVVREADGYQAHLVSPEFGLRRLVDETIGMVLEPVNMCVRRVHQVLIDAARYEFERGFQASQDRQDIQWSGSWFRMLHKAEGH